jgi:hypothetical protein
MGNTTRAQLLAPYYGKFILFSSSGEIVAVTGNYDANQGVKSYQEGNPDGITDGPAGTLIPMLLADNVAEEDAAFGDDNSDSDNDLRSPDYYSLNVSVAIPNELTGTFVGWNGTASLDRYGDFHWSPIGVTVGKSAYPVSASLTANWLTQSAKPTQQQLNNF